jgi:hypothetical protein
MPATLPAEEEHILRCLGASAIVDWDNLLGGERKVAEVLFDRRVG